MRKGIRWFLWYAVILHYAWGLCLFASPDPMGTTPIHGFAEYLPSSFGIGLALVAASTMAMFGLVRGQATIGHMVLLVPQQLLMMLSFFGATKCVIDGQYADGVTRPMLFIFADQFPTQIAGVFHTLSLLEFYAEGLWSRSSCPTSSRKPSGE